ncbi:protein MCM10 homolog [Acanthaster planci]|uniref:Protein MCM10 homolog n=1 Tax=Acanthaster planci TaxID=133434 RepID=A0A8B7YZI2_ACAPL|nr:protein MCM10 homolog [Acanthaster planci]
MSDEEYAYDDLDSLTALLDEEEESNPYTLLSSLSGIRKLTPSMEYSTQNGLSQISSGSSHDTKRPSPSQKTFSRGSQRSCRGQGSSSTQGQGSSSGENKETDESKSKEQLMDELKQLREQMKLLQSQQSSGDVSQTDQPKETFSEAITVPVEVKRVTKKKTAAADSKALGETRQYSTEEIGSMAGFTDTPTLSNPGDWEDWDEEERSTTEQKSTLFGKSSKRVAHTPKNTTSKPDKVSPYKCELCHELLDTRTALDVHMFKHRKESPHNCNVCGMSYHSKLKLEAHGRTHKSSATPTSSSSVSLGKLTSAAQGRRGNGIGGRGPVTGTAKKEDGHVETNRYSQIRILNPLVSSARLDAMMEGRKMLRLSILQKYLDTGPNKGDWVTMGVIVSKLPPKTSSKGKTFSIWKLSDLSVCDQTITIFLFSKAHDNHWKTVQGSVIGLLNASIMPPKDNGQDEGVSLSIDHPDKLLLLGTSKDFGHCRGKRKDGKPCSMVVNMAVSEFCQYHVQSEYKKHSAKRSDLQSSYGGVQPKAFKKKLGTNIIYGGQTYNPVSASVVKSGSTSSSRGKKDTKVTLQNLGVKGAKEIEQEARESILTLHGHQNSEDTLVKMSGANPQFKEMLSVPSLGSQNLIRHMVKVEEVSKPITTISAKDLLKQHQDDMRARQASRSLGHKSLSSSTLSKPCLVESNKRPTSRNSSQKLNTEHKGQFSPSDTENKAPVLGRGFNEDDDIVFEADSPQNKNVFVRSAPPLQNFGKSRSAIEARRNAIAHVRSKGQIEKADPNQVGGRKKGSLSPRKQKAVKRRVEEDLNRSLEDPSNAESAGQPAKKQKRSFLGQEVNLSQDELKAIVGAKSKHSGLLAEVQAEMEEQYFQQLEKKERLENMMDSIREKKCKVVSCKKCDYTWFTPSSLCASESHPLTRHEATLRYFKCKDCSNRTITFNRIPNKSCRICGCTSYERASMLKERKGPVLDSERLLIRGEEQKWVM